VANGLRKRPGNSRACTASCEAMTLCR